VMLQIVVEVAGTVCDVDCSVFSQTVDRQSASSNSCLKSGMPGGQKPHQSGTVCQPAPWRDSSVSLYIRIQAPTENVLISSTVNTTTNEVNARRARLVLGWVTVFGRVYHLGMQQAN